MLAACSKDAVTVNDAVRTGPEETMSHGMIVLGDRLENPYTTENMQEAYMALYPTKSRSDVKTSHLYVRFLPADEEEFDILTDSGLDLVD